jgi:lipopolysaccharide export system protein LptA
MVRRLAFLFFLLILPGSVWGKKVPITIKSDRMEVLENRDLVVFSGHVEARRLDLVLHADRLLVYYRKREGKREISKMVAVGNVKIRRGEWIASSGKAVYFKDQEKIVLEDNPQIWQGDNTVRGDKITLYLNENRSVAEARPGRKAEVTIFEE